MMVWKTAWKDLLNLRIYIPAGPALPLLWVFLRELLIMHKGVHCFSGKNGNNINIYQPENKQVNCGIFIK